MGTVAWRSRLTCSSLLIMASWCSASVCSEVYCCDRLAPNMTAGWGGAGGRVLEGVEVCVAPGRVARRCAKLDRKITRDDVFLGNTATRILELLDSRFPAKWTPVRVRSVRSADRLLAMRCAGMALAAAHT